VEEHACPVQPITPQNAKPLVTKFIFFDIEACLEAVPNSDVLRHVPNCIVFSTHFVGGLEERKAEPGPPIPEWYICHNMQEAYDWLFQRNPGDSLRRFSERRGWCVMAHNNLGYDANFFLNYAFKLADRQDIQAIRNGMKFKALCINGVRFKDSALFIAAPLSKIAVDFGLDVDKDDYPYKFNIAANERYDGELPDRKYFKTDYAHSGERVPDYAPHHFYRDGRVKYDAYLTRLLEDMLPKEHGAWWHMGETIKYCMKDVFILQTAWLQYRAKMIEATDTLIDPSSYMTIGQVCMSTYRSMIMPACPP
jgi:hypothetical protein